MKRKRHTYGVYVIELNGDPNYVYVGQSSHPPEKRLLQHLTGSIEHKAARVFRKGARGKLRPDLYDYLNRFDTSEEAMKFEALIAKDLREEGFRVEGGH